MGKKKIVITGGTTGIGYACAAYLLNAGYDVIITGKSEKNLAAALEKLDHRATGIVSDTSVLADIDHLVMEIKGRFGKVDGLFVNAGIFKSAGLEATTEALFDETMNVNFKGAFFTVQKFVPLLNNPSSVVLTSSIVVFKAFAGTSVYTASKAALESVARVFNVELAAKGIRVNILAPGVTESPIQQKSGMSGEAIKDLLEHFSNTSPIGRILNPDDMAPMLEFLMSDKSLVLRNEKIIVDGGTTM